jgi:predicted acetyltransferase
MNLNDLVVKPFDKKTREQYLDLCQFCFNMPASSRDRYFINQDEFDCSLGAWDGDRLACGMWYWPYDMRVRGQFVRMAGVAAVATWPEYRNQGIVRHLLGHLQERMREDKRPVSVLAPFKWSFYRDLGWEQTFDTLRLRFEPEKVKQARTPGFQSRQATVDEWQTFEEVHMAASERYNGPVCRSRDYWKRRMFEGPVGNNQVWLVEKGGEPRGFVVGRINDAPTGADPELYRVLQAVWLDGEAQRAVFNHLGSLRDQIKQVLLFLPPDSDWSHCFKEFKFESKLEPKMMTKVVDLKPALEALSFDSSLSGSLAIEMTPDQGAPWNDGGWQCKWASGKLSANRIQTADAHAVTLTPQVLAQLYIGYRTVGDMIAAGQLVAGKEQADLLSSAFPKYPAYLDDWF